MALYSDYCCISIGCSIPLADDPDAIAIPKRTPDNIIKRLSYISVDEQGDSKAKNSPLFGGHQSWKQREESFNLNTTMKVEIL